ncbi:hypothetical protein DB31_7251 [Hyalangium minutum]|uniref:CBS domain-containing protein n=1 Tax=Hyalangium minutum TaxID=394096 RepID=A0A085WK01_9BACT|nr:hypothetical protein DB31_7251 [Hyalangium minutum]
MEEKGTLLGLISEARILEAWEVDPLLRVSEVMEECGPPVDWGRQAYGH